MNNNTLLAVLFLLISSVTAFGQFRMVSNGTPMWSQLNDSTYTSNIPLFSDLTGNGFIGIQIDTSFRVFDGIENIYRIDSVWNKTFSSAEVKIVKLEAPYSKPANQIIIYDPNNEESIPSTPVSSSGMTFYLQSAINTYNSRLYNSNTQESSISVSDTPLTENSKIRQGVTTGTYIYDDEQGEQKLKYDYVVDSISAILEGKYELGKYIQVASTEAIYYTSQDSTTNWIKEGSAIDSLVIIPLNVGYAILTLNDVGFVDVSHMGLPTDTVGVPESLLSETVNKALLYTNKVYVPTGEYRSNDTIKINHNNELVFDNKASVEIIGDKPHLYAWSEIPFSIEGGYHYSNNNQRRSWLVDVAYYNDQDNDKHESRKGPIIKNIKGEFAISRSVPLQQDTAYANGIRIRATTYNLNNPIGTAVGTFFGLVENNHLYRCDTALYFQNLSQNSSYRLADPLEVGRIANNAFRVINNVFDDNIVAIAADTLCNGMTFQGNQLQVNPRSPEPTIGIANKYSKSWTFDGIGYDGYDTLVDDSDQIAIHSNYYQFGTEIYGNLQHRFGFINLSNVNINTASKFQFDDDPYGAGEFLISQFGGRYRLYERNGNGIHFQTGGNSMYYNASGMYMTGVNRIIGSSGIPIDEIRTRKLNRLYPEDSLLITTRVHIDDTLEVDDFVDINANLNVSGTLTNSEVGQSSSFSETTDGSGDFTISHTLGVDPTIRTAKADGSTYYHIQAQSSTTSTVTYRVFDAAGSPVTSTAVTGSFTVKE
jgi:hypothetical protein